MLTRRQFLESMIAGGAILACKPLLAFPDQFILSRDEFYEFLRRPVRVSLRDTSVHFVTEEEYDGVINQRDVENERKRNVIAYIYNDDNSCLHLSEEGPLRGSRGLAAFAFTVDRRYPSILQVAVCFSNQISPSQRELCDAGQRYSLTGLPGMIFYKKLNGQISRIDEMNGGIGLFDQSEGRGSYTRNVELICDEFIESALIENF